MEWNLKIQEKIIRSEWINYEWKICCINRVIAFGDDNLKYTTEISRERIFNWSYKQTCNRSIVWTVVSFNNKYRTRSNSSYLIYDSNAFSNSGFELSLSSLSREFIWISAGLGEFVDGKLVIADCEFMKSTSLELGLRSSNVLNGEFDVCNSVTCIAMT